MSAGFSFAVSGDLHLDSPLSGYEPQQAEYLKNKQLKSLMDLCKYCKSNKLDYLFLCGDIFDNLKPEKALLREVQQSFRLCEQTQVIIVPGNHDPYFPGAFWDDPDWPANLIIIKKANCYLDFEQHKLCIYSSPFISQSSSYSLFETFNPPLDKHKFNLLLLHGDLLSSGSESRYNPIPLEWLKESGLDLALFGHIHSSSELQKVAHTHYLYPGTLMGRGFDECGSKGFYVGKVKFTALNNLPSRNELEISFVPLRNARFHTLSTPLQNFAETASLEEGLAQYLEKQILASSFNPERDFFRIILEGTTAEKIETAYLKAYLEDKVQYLEILDHSLPELNLHNYLHSEDLAQYVARICLSLREQISAKEEIFISKEENIDLHSTEGEAYAYLAEQWKKLYSQTDTQDKLKILRAAEEKIFRYWVD